jgi:predicted TIM-barrel fold metal-dependent hydrolase
MDRHDACANPSHVYTTRRGFMTSLAAIGAAGLLPAAARAAPFTLIDLHHHFYPPSYVAAAEQWARLNRPGQPNARERWSVAASVEEMDKHGTGTAILSISSTPGPWWGVDVAGMRRLARDCNEFAAQMMRDHPGRFGLFAQLPMPDVEGSLTEIAYAFDVLKADGIGLQTNFGKSWPGDRQFQPVWEELNRRKALVYFHPVNPDCCGNLVTGVGDSMLEYPTDTARAALSLLFNGVLVRFPDIRWLFSHAGGPIPMLAGRWISGAKNRKDLASVAPSGVEHELKRLYYEIANSAFPPTLAALVKFAPVAQILFGTDFPYYGTAENAAGLASFGLPAADLAAIQRGNAMRLIPRLAA